MISARNDYDFVTIEEPLAVNGGIMPLREEKDTLRAEDVAFCLEGACERAYTTDVFYPSGDSAHVDEIVAGWRWQFAIWVLESTARRAVRKDYKFEEKVLPGSAYWELFDMDDCYPDCVVRYISSDDMQFSSGQPVRTQPVMDVFKDLDDQRRFFEEQSYGGIYFHGGATSSERTESGDGVEDYLTEPLVGSELYKRECISFYDIPDDDKEPAAHSGIATRTATAGDFTIKMMYGSPDYVAKGMAVAIIREETFDTSKPDDEMQRFRYFSVCIDLATDGAGGFILPSDVVTSSALSFVNFHFGGVPSPPPLPSPAQAGAANSVNYYLSLSDVFLITELGDHTNWKSA